LDALRLPRSSFMVAWTSEVGLSLGNGPRCFSYVALQLVRQALRPGAHVEHMIESFRLPSGSSLEQSKQWRGGGASSSLIAAYTVRRCGSVYVHIPYEYSSAPYSCTVLRTRTASYGSVQLAFPAGRVLCCLPADIFRFSDQISAWMHGSEISLDAWI
jgi:hypothetical protein